MDLTPGAYASVLVSIYVQSSRAWLVLITSVGHDICGLHCDFAVPNSPREPYVHVFSSSTSVLRLI